VMIRAVTSASHEVPAAVAAARPAAR